MDRRHELHDDGRLGAGHAGGALGLLGEAPDELAHMSSAGSSSAGVALAFEDYLDTIGEEADRLVDAAARGLGVAVPTCPGWRVGDLVGHLSGLFLRFAAGLSSEPSDARTRPRCPRGTATSWWISRPPRRSCSCGRLARRGLDAPFTSPSGRELTGAWLARRMALETAVHRVDVELARGRANPVERELAVDGIDEAHPKKTAYGHGSPTRREGPRSGARSASSAPTTPLPGWSRWNVAAYGCELVVHRPMVRPRRHRFGRAVVRLEPP